MDLSLFVCFSSTAALFGVGNQANYAAANLYLDALVWRRRADGLAGCSVNFGPWGGEGMAADEVLSRQQKALGFRALEPSLGLDAMEAIISSNITQAAVVDVDWSTFKPLAEALRPWPLLEYLDADDEAETETVSEQSALTKQLIESEPANRRPLLLQVMREEVAQVLEMAPGDLSDTVGLFDLGMDSLMAIEFTQRLGKVLGLKLQATMVFSHSNIGALSDHLLKDVLRLEEEKSDAAEVAEALSDEELEALILKKIIDVQEKHSL